MGRSVERLPYQGESPADRLAFEQYLNDVQRGKSLLQLLAAKKAGPLWLDKSRHHRVVNRGKWWRRRELKTLILLITRKLLVF